ncbi:hypothetical protein HCDSEM_121 [Candidatus Hodgkinia cicadicola Dsem]|nr:hypothetical protein HCDSEM_121 [Candidatus Hodgkinia cicadicola Dsem]
MTATAAGGDSLASVSLQRPGAELLVGCRLACCAGFKDWS